MSNHDLAAAFRRAADHLEKLHAPLSNDNVKFWLLAALNDLDRSAAYGNPGRGIDELLGKETVNERT